MDVISFKEKKTAWSDDSPNLEANNTVILVQNSSDKKLSENTQQKTENTAKKSRIMDVLIENLSCEMYHAILGVIDSEHYLIKIHLSLSLLVFYGFAAYTTITLIMSYLEYGTSTLVSEIFEAPSTFPKVTICNLNQFTTRFAYDFVKLMDTNVNQMSLFNDTLMENVNLWEKRNWLAWPIYFAAGGFLSNQTDSYKKLMGQSLDDILLSCQFNFQPCTANDFSWSYDTFYGNCYTFNSGFISNGSKVDLRKQYVSGYPHGLQLDFYVNYNQNLSFFNSILGGKGAIVRIDNLTHIIDHNIEGIYVSPGACTNLALRREIKATLPQPYSSCLIDQGRDSSFDSELFNKIKSSPYDYTQSFCLKQCLQKLIIDNCKCRFTIMASVIEANVCENQTQVLLRSFRSFFNSNSNGWPELVVLKLVVFV
jgi:hypothetical protein